MFPSYNVRFQKTEKSLSQFYEIPNWTPRLFRFLRVSEQSSLSDKTANPNVIITIASTSRIKVNFSILITATWRAGWWWKASCPRWCMINTCVAFPRRHFLNTSHVKMWNACQSKRNCQASAAVCEAIHELAWKWTCLIQNAHGETLSQADEPYSSKTVEK